MPDSRRPGVAARRILLVDDEQALRFVLHRYLGRQGWQVSEARSAAEALELLEDLAVLLDVVLVDLHLPDLSGSALCRRILLDHPTLAGRLLVTTGDTAFADEELEHATLDCPVIGKPFGMPDLDRALAAMLGRLPRPALPS
ncbi:MAG: response regulator receiver [Gemmatimonadetes bacterium]|jgi:two-component system OmpR family response regulator|nr:response regulator receiver [Gemmatimonadota bacterium]